MTANGLALGEEADFEAQNYLPALNLKRSISAEPRLQLTTEPAFLPEACYAFALLFLSYALLSFRIFLGALAKQALLQFLVCALACENCKCACLLRVGQYLLGAM